MPLYVIGAAWVIGVAILAGACAYFARHFTNKEGRAENNESAGQVFTIVGGLQAVLIAFVLIGLFDAVGAAQDTSYQEANSLVAMTWAGDELPQPAGTEIRSLAVTYAHQVINTEWPQMAAHNAVSTTGWSTLTELQKAISDTKTTSLWQDSRKAEASNQLLTLYQSRQQRLTDAAAGVSTVIWFALAIGSLLSLGLPLLFGGPKMRAHIVIVSTFAATLAVLLFAIYQLQNPFAGGASIGPDAFRGALGRLQ
ncbi:MAG TPA: hypothetical protein VF892_08895 [Pseudonocardiaceae bacterium]